MNFLCFSLEDLIDEACASIRVQLDSQPEIIDQLGLSFDEEVFC